ncbi:MAG: hypothetical protein IPJ76_05265 [Flavobacteriales bacterium]|nr:MAG: hypothetical protein IPJ76_05265 [Flavobacteriales bacterium]
MERNPPTATNDRWERALFLLLLATSLFAVWRLPVFLTQDGPSHLYNARILLELWGDDALGYGRFFTLNTDFSPNWTGNLLLAGLLKLFPAVVAEKVLVSAYVLLLAFGFKQAVRALSAGTPWLSSLVFVSVFNYHLLYGFFNFCLGLALLFWTIAALHRFVADPSRKRTLMCGALLLALMVTHPVPFVVALLCAGIMVVPALRRTRGDRKGLLVLTWRFAAALLPAVIMFAVFLPPSDDHQGLLVDKLNTTTIKDLLHMEHLLVFPAPERPLFRLLSMVFIGLLLLAGFTVRKSRGIRNGPLLALLLMCVLVHFHVNDELAGGAYLTSRMALISWMVFALWLACVPMPQRLARPIAVAVGLVALALGTVRHLQHGACAAVAGEYIAHLKPINEGMVVLPLCFSPKGETASDTLSPRIGLFKHMSGYAAADQRFISLDNYEANTAYFQTRWRSEVNPFTQLCASGDCDIEGQPHTADVDGYEMRSGQRIDVVVHWGAPIRMTADSVVTTSAFATRLIGRDH